MLCFRKNTGQSFLEYSVLMLAVVTALISMQAYIQNGVRQNIGVLQNRINSDSASPLAEPITTSTTLYYNPNAPIPHPGGYSGGGSGFTGPGGGPGDVGAPSGDNSGVPSGISDGVSPGDGASPTGDSAIG